VLGAAFIIITMAIGTLFWLAVFLKPLEDSMGWKRSSVSAIALMNWIAIVLAISLRPPTGTFRHA
jgi:hypothetical protein